MAEDLKYTVDYDASDAIKSINQLDKEIGDLNKDLAASASAFTKANQPLNSLTKNLANTAVAVNKFDSSIKRSVPGSNQATQSLTNLSRVLQDAPFGFLGIANNLNPLLESFQRLQSETGSVGKSLKALGSSILGAGGIGLALSAFQFLALGGAESIGKLFQSAEAGRLAAAKKELEEFNKELNKSKSSAIETGVQLKAFIDVAKNSALPLEQRNEALKRANDIMGKYGETITIANVATEKITKQTELFTNALIAQAVAQAYAGRIADLYIKGREALNKFVVANKKAKKAIEEADQAVGENAETYANIAIASQNARLSASNEYYGIQKQIADAQKELNIVTEQSTQIFGKLGEKVKGSKKDVLTIAEVLAAMNKEIAFLESKEINLHTNEAQNKIKAIEQAIEDLVKKVGLDTNNPLVLNLYTRIRGIKFDEFIKDLNDQLRKTRLGEVDVPVGGVNIEIKPEGIQVPMEAVKKGLIERLKGLKVPITIGLQNANIEGLQNILNEQLALIAAFNQSVRQSIEAVNQSIAVGIGEAIGNILSGQQNVGQALGSLFGGIFKTLGDQIKQLGVQLIAYSKLLKALQVSFKSINPAAKLAVGIALVALGTSISSFANRLPGFAEGGLIGGKGSGTSDSILARVSNGEFVVSADAVRKYGVGFLNSVNSLSLPSNSATPTRVTGLNGDGLSLNVVVSGQIRNNVIKISNDRASQSQSITT